MRKDRFLILSDGKPGHVNQSIAFAKHLNIDYDVYPVRFKGRLAKALSYLFDQKNLHLESLLCVGPVSGKYHAVVSAGSETYYANRVLAKKLDIKSVAIMLPKGYRYDFDLIIAQHHDRPPEQNNIISVPINLAFVEPQGLVRAEEGKKYVSVIVGGDSKRSKLSAALLREQLRQVFEFFPDHEFWLTTSRRTPSDVEQVLRDFTWTRAVYFSQEQINPIPDFLAQSEYVFLTADSTSMISEAVSFGSACVELLAYEMTTSAGNKLACMVNDLRQNNALHLFDNALGSANQKIDLPQTLKEVSV